MKKSILMLAGMMLASCASAGGGYGVSRTTPTSTDRTEIRQQVKAPCDGYPYDSYGICREALSGKPKPLLTCRIHGAQSFQCKEAWRLVSQPLIDSGRDVYENAQDWWEERK